MQTWKCLTAIAVGVLAASAAACGDDKTPTTPTGSATTLTAPGLASPADNTQLDTLRPTLTVRNATADQTGARVYEFQISDNANFTAVTASNVAGFAATVSKTGVPEGAAGTTSFTVEQDLQPTTLFYWRARAVQGAATGPWSATAKLKSKLVGFNRAGELYDPLIHGETVGDLVGSTTFLPGRGIQLNTGQSHVRYLLQQTITNGEFSMDVEGLRANAPGDKSKVFGMQEGQGDFIVNRYRVDVQYRGTTGAPPNAITFRALYGDADDLDVRYEPDSAKRFASVFLLNPSTTYHWKASWGNEFRVSYSRAEPPGPRFTTMGSHRQRASTRPTRSTPTWVPRWAGAATKPHRLPAQSIATSGSRTGPGQPRSAVPCGETARQ